MYQASKHLHLETVTPLPDPEAKAFFDAELEAQLAEDERYERKPLLSADGPTDSTDDGGYYGAAGRWGF
jgi:hypothetical protein